MPALDAFGNPLCITSVDHDGTAPAPDHSSLPACCTFGCGMISPLLVPATETGIALSRPLPSLSMRLGSALSVEVEAPDHDPGSPRAPPVTA